MRYNSSDLDGSGAYRARIRPPAMANPTPRPHNPLAWVPTAYFAEGIPYAMVIWVAGTLFKDLGHSDGDITVALASVGLAWSLKPFWAAFLDMFRTKRFFVLTMELLMAVLLGLFALALPLPNYFQVVIAILWVLAFASATQDICVDGIYITSLDAADQAKYIGVQGMAWNVGRIFATAGVIGIAGLLQEQASYEPKTAWAVALGLSGATMAALALYHVFMLPPGSKTRDAQSSNEVAATFVDSVRDFFRKDKIWGMLAFVFLFRSAEGLLLVEAPLFLQAPLHEGGLGMTLVQKGIIDGTISTAVSIVGGLLGGVFVSRYGLVRTLFVLALCLNLPNLCYVYLSWSVSPDAPLSMTTIAVFVSIEKFGYSFGFVGNMLYMMQQISPGRYHMTHYAFCTALMNLVLIPTQMASGPLADWMGYRSYFVFVVIATIPSIVVAKFAPFPRDASKEAS
jgi:PAT family beta-lactamase induction signal transducer AmpG